MPGRSSLTSRTSILLSCAAAGCGSADLDAVRLGEVEQALCPAGDTVPGIDVSYYQGNVDWPAVASSGMTFAIARVSYGSGFVDPKFAKNWDGIAAAGLVRGTYQFFRPSQDPVAQAKVLVDQIEAQGGLEPGDLPPVLDVEDSEGVKDSTVIAKMHDWLDHVEQAIGRKPMIYTSPGYWNALGNPSGFESYPLWVAHWGVDCPTLPSGSWSDFSIWQEGPFSVDGIANAVDGNYFNGSLADLQAFAKGVQPAAHLGDTGAIAVVPRLDGSAELFVRSTGGDVLHAHAGAGQPWGATETLASGASCGFSATAWPPTQKVAELWAPDGAGSTMQLWWSKSADAWSDPADFGGDGLTQLSSLAWPDGHADVFALGSDGAIWVKTFVKGDGWAEWMSLGGDFVTGAAALLDGEGDAHAFATDAAGAVWRSKKSSSAWSDWTSLDGPPVSSRPAPVRWPDGSMGVFAQAAGGALVYADPSADAPAFEDLGWSASLFGPPSVVMAGEAGATSPRVFGRDDAGRVVLASWSDGALVDLGTLDGVTAASDPLAWIRADGRVEVFVVDEDGSLMSAVEEDSGTWSAWTEVVAADVDACAPPLPAPPPPPDGDEGDGEDPGPVVEPVAETSSAGAAGCGCREAGHAELPPGILLVLAGFAAVLIRRLR